MHTPHSGMGIAAFITAVCGAVLMLGLVVIAGIIETTTPGGMEETSMSAILVGLGLMLTALMQLVAFGLGVAGAVQADRRRVFAVLGLVFSIGSMLGVVLLMVIGSLS
ncbi:hypothetical protein ORK51_08070 [Stenotrophomonas rhizophila]|uniref:hypothetical protein n=1 Tax=Stenotrophomonas rhizophila TaxID=216778 RepID=UPI00224B5B9D|nr:hypothetical protein [Stenotrophomonas rhizophila]MCX2920121.1 hypothetical protein [Stenotrophomonas rhizophila]